MKAVREERTGRNEAGWGTCSKPVEEWVASPPLSFHVSIELVAKGDAQSPLVEERGREATRRAQRGEAAVHRLPASSL